MGVAVYGTEVYVTGGSSHTVSIFSLDGELVRHLDTQASVSGPQGIAFDDRGRFVITSFYTGVVARYRPDDPDPEIYFEDRGIEVARSVAYQPLTGGPQEAFIRGDFNRDEQLDISDPVAVLGYLFVGLSPTRCPDAGDANDDGRLDVTDAIYSLGHLFGGGPPPPAPFPASGPDPTADELECH